MFSRKSRGKCVFYFAGSRSPFGWSVFRYTSSNCVICYQKKRKSWIQVLMNKKITPGYHGLTCLIPKEAEQRDLGWMKRCNHINSSPSLPGLPRKRKTLLGSPAHVRDSRQPLTPADRHTLIDAFWWTSVYNIHLNCVTCKLLVIPDIYKKVL